MAIAFFDLDKTVLARNSATLWVRAELRAGFITRWQAMRAAVWLVRYSLGAADLEDALAESVMALRGSSETMIAERTVRFYEQQVRPVIRPGARRVLAEHRARGDKLVLLTSSSQYLSAPVARELELDHFLCNQLLVADGLFTGHAAEPLCFGPGKVAVATRYADALGVSLSQCAFYSDSASDLPMLESVGTPVAINPDPRLKKTARARGWAIHDWGEP